MDCVSKSDIDQHLTLGMQLLARGQYSDALSHFHAAIGKEGPFINYVTQFAWEGVEGSVMLMHKTKGIEQLQRRRSKVKICVS